MIDLSGDIWERWKTRRQELEVQKVWHLAGLFSGHEGPNFRQAKKKVLYTGKATAGEFTPAHADEDYFGCNKKAFWSFAARLSLLTGGNPEDLENIAWSNICKIGVTRGNPSAELVKAQADLAIETLRQEWKELDPTLVVFVTEGFQDDLIYEAIGVMRGADGFEQLTLEAGTYWKRTAVKGLPAFLWMKHPQGKRRDYLATAERLAAEILLES